MNHTPHLLAVLIAAAFFSQARADEFAARCADRAAIERVYHGHRLGTKESFEHVMPQALIEQVVRQDQHKEAVLKKVYGVEITPAMVAAEVARIDATTRAPEVLAEIKHALGDDASRFAAAMARPIIVERELRSRFDTDDTLHAPQRQEAERLRESLVAGKTVKDMHEVTWKLTPKPDDRGSEFSGQGSAIEKKPQSFAAPSLPTQSKTKSATYTNEATVQRAQVLASPDHASPDKEPPYFEDLEPPLQSVLRAQLQKPGDVSEVVELPGGYAVFLAKEKSIESLRAASLTIAKRSYEGWLGPQNEANGH